VLEHLTRLEARGSAGLVARVTGVFVQDGSAQVAALVEAVQRRDAHTIARVAHTLQGSSAMVGAESLAKCCAEIVAAVRRQEFERAEGVLQDIRARFAAIEETIRAHAPQRPTPAAPLPAVTRPIGLRRRILVVDDDDTTRSVTQAMVEALGHECETARDGLEGLAKLHLGIDLVLLDVVMPGMDGFAVCRRIRQDPQTQAIPVIMVTSMASHSDRLMAVEVGANDFIAKPVDEAELRIRSTSILKMKAAQDELKHYQAHLEEMVEQRTASLRKALEGMAEAQRAAYQAQLDTVERLAIVAEYKDKVTAKHIRRMSEYCAVIARGLKLTPGEVELILHASRMHDVGKIGVPDAILQKPASLSTSEWTVMRRHPTVGSRILDRSSSELLEAGRVIALCHHERWDGSGYPEGLAGENIPLLGRICAVADVFDAVTSERPYKPAYPNEDALRILRDGRGIQFDPRVVDVFLECFEEILAIQTKHRDVED
jgi:putative two-component system response regulator